MIQSVKTTPQRLPFTKDGMPVGMELGELVAELSLLTNAGSETTTAALQNIMHNLCRNPRCMDKLYEEIASVTTDEELEENPVIPYDKIKFLPYLRAVIDETLRDRPSLAIGLPRVTPKEGTHIAGTWVPGNTTVSIPTWGMHHDPAVFERPFEFLPERWLGESGQALQKYMLAFSAGSRQCVGRNVAYTEISIIVSTIVRRYRFALPSPEWKPTVYETMVIRSGPMPIKIWRR
jgi:cytochrome P450